MTVCALLLAGLPANVTAAEAAPPTIISMTDEFMLNADHQQECHDQLALLALDVPGCEFEDDTRQGFGMTLGFLSLEAGNVGPIPLTGDVTAHLTSASGREIIFTCTWTDGVFGSCRIDALTGWPNLGEGYSFDCYSQPGALGNWGECFVVDF